jgi:hypothetical protein
MRLHDEPGRREPRMNKANSSMLLFFHKRFSAFAHSGRLNVQVIRFALSREKARAFNRPDLNA